MELQPPFAVPLFFLLSFVFHSVVITQACGHLLQRCRLSATEIMICLRWFAASKQTCHLLNNTFIRQVDRCLRALDKKGSTIILFMSPECAELCLKVGLFALGLYTQHMRSGLKYSCKSKNLTLPCAGNSVVKVSGLKYSLV